MFDMFVLSSSRNQKKCQRTKRKYDEKIKRKWIYRNTVDDDSGNVESATDDAATMEILLENPKKNIFWVVNFVFIK